MVRTEPKVPPNPPARGDDAPTYSSEYFRAMKAKVQNMSALELIQAVGVHQQLLEASWPKFLVVLRPWRPQGVPGILLEVLWLLRGFLVLCPIVCFVVSWPCPCGSCGRRCRGCSR